MSDLKWYQAGDLYTTHSEARMETRFIDGGEYVDRQAYIDMRDENSRLRERITELEANSVLVLKHWEAEEPGDLCFNEVTGLHAEADLYRIAELEAENHTFRMAQKACETCDAPTMQRIAELKAQLDVVFKYIDRMHDPVDTDPLEKTVAEFIAEFTEALGGRDEST